MNRIAKFYFFAVVFCLVSVLPVYAENNPNLNMITVSGDAEIKVVPDEVIFNLGVETWDQDLAVAKSENDQRAQKIIKAAKEQKVDEKNIQTDYISIEPEYDDRGNQRKFVDFLVHKNIVITLKDTSKFEELLSAILSAGANYVHGIEFRTTELRKYRDQARALAIKAAQEKAAALAKELGRTIGRPHKIQEGKTDWWSGYNSWRSGYGSQMSQNAIQNTSSPSEGESSVALGMISVNANVTVSFELQ
jgi:hypothetical protein